MKASALPVKFKFFVVEEAVYDMLYAASAIGYVADQPVNMTKLNGSATSASNLQKSASVIWQGSITGTVSTTAFIDTTLTQASTDYWKGRIIIFTSGAAIYQATDITAFNSSTHQLTYSTLSVAPSAADTYVIV